MAVSTTNAQSGPYLTNGVTTVFPFTFTAPTADEVDVVFADDAGYADVSFGPYSVTLGQEAGGAVAFASPPPAGYRAYVLLDPSFRQEITFENGSAWRAEPVNEGYDRGAARDQVLKRDIGRSIIAPVGESGLLLPPAQERASKALFFDPAGNTSTISVDDFAEPARLSAAEATASALLLALMNGGYFETQYNPPPADAAEGQTYLATQDGKAALLRKVAGVGQIVFEFATKSANFDRSINVKGSFALTDLNDDDTANGIWLGAGGNSLSFQTMFSSPQDGAERDNQRATLLVAAETSDDSNSEEQTFCVKTVVKTGYAAPHQNNHAYALGANVTRATNNYRCTKAGVSGATGGPSGKAGAISDGSVVWRWINDDAINAKVGIYNEIEAIAGGGRAWAQASNIEMQSGYNADFGVCHEFDLTNNSGFDSQFGQYNKYNLYIFTKGASRSTASIEVTTTNTTNYAAYWGLHFSGEKLAQNSVIGIDASSTNGIGFGVAAGGPVSPTFSDSAIKDGSNAAKGITLAGNYSSSALEVSGITPAAITLNGTYSNWLLYTPGPFRVYPNGALEARSMKLDLASVGDFINDTDAAAGGIGLGGIYRNGGALRIRIV